MERVSHVGTEAAESAMFEVKSHTADVRLKVRASNLEELFREALRGLMHVMEPKTQSSSDAPALHEIALESENRTALLVDFLNEALWRAHVYGERYDDVAIHRLSTAAIDAEITGWRVTGFDVDVKAVTYHEVEVVQGEQGEWTTPLVLDI